jgi:hypothetical protein
MREGRGSYLSVTAGRPMGLTSGDGDGEEVAEEWWQWEWWWCGVAEVVEVAAEDEDV